MKDTLFPGDGDVLPGQIVEDDSGRMHILPEDMLVDEPADGNQLLRENDFAVENMENDLPCTDVEPEQEDGDL